MSSTFSITWVIADLDAVASADGGKHKRADTDLGWGLFSSVDGRRHDGHLSILPYRVARLAILVTKNAFAAALLASRLTSGT
jgi:hypothetical protein